MNHLAGLDVLPDPTANLPQEEAQILARFKEAYHAKKPSNASEEICYQIHSTSSLPECGWRSLDDATLYRYLCADRHKGTLQPEVSLQRLIKCLQFRRDHKCDEILNVGGGTSVSMESLMELEDKIELSFPRERTASVSSLCSGMFSEEYEISFAPPRKRLGSEFSVTTATSATTVSTYAAGPTSGVTPAQVEKYQRLRVRQFVGLDKEGRPVMWERIGNFLGMGSAIHQFSVEDWIALYVWDLERHAEAMRRASIETGKPIEKYVYIGDLDGIMGSILRGSIWTAVPLLKALVKTVEDHYPEIVAKVVVFNVPRVASVVWEAIKQFMDPVTAAKVQLCPGFPRQQILDMMDESVLPKEYGGSNPVELPKAAKK